MKSLFRMIMLLFVVPLGIAGPTYERTRGGAAHASTRNSPRRSSPWGWKWRSAPQRKRARDFSIRTESSCRVIKLAFVLVLR